MNLTARAVVSAFAASGPLLLARKPVDILVEGGTVVTCDREDRVFAGDVLVRAGRIVSLGPQARRDAMGLVRVLDARGSAVVPGMVQAHVHLCKGHFRGMAYDLPLLEA